jgi:hypothetical protein
MRNIFILPLFLVATASAASAQTTIVGDAWVLGRVTVGTPTPAARMTVVPSSVTPGVVFQASGVDLTPFLRVANDGTVGLSTYSAARLDVTGSGDSANVGLLLRSGNMFGNSGMTQMTFGAGGAANERHAINSVHLSSTAHNSLDFLIWTPDAGTTSIATMTVMSLVTISTASGAAVHVRPVGDPIVELVVSNGASTGGGTIHVASQVTPSSRRFKTDISYLSDEERLRAYEDVKGLRPVSFRYMKMKGKTFTRDRRAALHRGILYEEAPQAVRGPGDSVSLDQRLLESEMAFQVLARHLESLEKEVGR